MKYNAGGQGFIYFNCWNCLEMRRDTQRSSYQFGVALDVFISVGMGIHDCNILLLFVVGILIIFNNDKATGQAPDISYSKPRQVSDFCLVESEVN